MIEWGLGRLLARLLHVDAGICRQFCQSCLVLDQRRLTHRATLLVAISACSSWFRSSRYLESLQLQPRIEKMYIVLVFTSKQQIHTLDLILVITDADSLKPPLECIVTSGTIFDNHSSKGL